MDSLSRIYPPVQKTPLVLSEALSVLAHAPVRLKCDFLQETGSFKIRGAANFISKLSPEDRKKGLIAVSTGNHGRAVAFICRMENLSLKVFVSSLVPEDKLVALKELGCDVCVRGSSQDETFEAAIEDSKKTGAIIVPPFDHQHIIEGQSSIVKEIIDQHPEVEEIIVPVSGGGLAAGVILGAKKYKPSLKIFGVSIENGSAMFESIRQGKPVKVTEPKTLADSLGGGIGLENKYTFDVVRTGLKEFIVLSEEEIALAMQFAFQKERICLEGAGATPIGAILSKKINYSLKNTVLVLTGRNVSSREFLEVIRHES